MRRSVLWTGLVAAVVLVTTLAMEYLGVTDQGYDFPILFSLVFSLVWGSIDASAAWKAKGRWRPSSDDSASRP